MQIFSIYSGVQKQTFPQQQLPIRNGQVIHGKVLQFDVNRKALVEIGNQRFLADIQAPLDTLETYWFQVYERDGKLELKVLAEASQESKILNQFGLEPTAEARHLLQALKKWHLPLDKTQFVQAESWLQHVDDVNKGIQVIRFILEQHLPFTEKGFFSLYALSDGQALTERLHHLYLELAKYSDGDSEIFHHLQKLLGKEQRPVNWANGQDVQRVLLQLLQIFGLSKEAENNVHTLYEKLASLLAKKDLPPAVKEAIVPVLDYIKGARFLYSERDSFVQWGMVIPLPLPEQTVDLFIQWTGKRKNKKMLDPDFCRIVFQLNMPRLGETEVTMNIQKRMISLHIRTDFPGAHELGEPLIQSLKNRLAEKNYTLGTVRFERNSSTSQQAAFNLPPTFTKQHGNMDVRI